ncbi:hypothetical protein V8C26DRAFT_407132 [Trichoderma gracile]
MQTEKTDSSILSGAAAERPWTYKDTPHDTETEKDHVPFYTALAACGTTAMLNIIAVTFNNNNLRAQICSPSRAPKAFSYVQPFIEYEKWCEASPFLVVVMTCLHWSCIFSLFNKQKPRWKTKLLPRIIVVTLFTLLPLATVTRDPATLFVQILPVVTDVYVVAALVIDFCLERRLRVENAC